MSPERKNLAGGLKKTHQNWKLFLDKGGKMLYEMKHNKILAHRTIGRNSRHDKIHTFESAKNDVSRLTLYKTRVKIIAD